MRDRLEEAWSEAQVISLERGGFESSDEIGYVTALGDSLALFARISDAIRFDGYSILRIEDITEIDLPHEHDAFVESALRLRGESIEDPPEIDLGNMASAIRTAGRLYDVVTLHKEAEDPDLCQVGCVRSVSADSMQLIEIDPDADWYDEPTQIDTAAVTRMDVGGAYEEALVLVGGRCPTPLLRPVD